MKKTMTFKHAFLLVCVGWIGSATCANVTQISRYATVENKPLIAQVNPLLTVQQIHFPRDVQTVGAALAYWMQYSGFSLVEPSRIPGVLKTVLEQPLPQVDRNLGPLTIQDGLEVLVGQQVFTLVQDPLRRQVNFRLKPNYAQAVNQKRRLI